MGDLTIKDISAVMRDIDICMMTTHMQGGALESRPMSNNREVEYNGDAYFFADGSSAVIAEIISSPQVNLSYVHKPALVGKPTYISVSGDAAIIRERSAMEQHWVPDAEIWFAQGLDTPGLVMIHVRAKLIHYWHGMKQGEIRL